MSKQLFDDFLKQKLTSAEYDNLLSLINKRMDDVLSPHRLTKIKNSPEKMNAIELFAFSVLLERSPAFLFQEYHCGWNGVHIGEMEQINKDFQKKFKQAEV